LKHVKIKEKTTRNERRKKVKVKFQIKNWCLPIALIHEKKHNQMKNKDNSGIIK
jgi:hypothetical protein